MLQHAKRKGHFLKIKTESVLNAKCYTVLKINNNSSCVTMLRINSRKTLSICCQPQERGGKSVAPQRFLLDGLHGGDYETRKLMTLHNSTKPFIPLVSKTITPHNSTQLYIGCVSIGLSRGLIGLSLFYRVLRCCYAG